MAVSERIGDAYRYLAEARAPEAESLAEAMRSSRVVGVLGEAEVGKTETIKQALRSPTAALLTLDLDGIAGDGQLAFLILKQIAAAFLGPPGFSVLSVGTLVPTSIEAERVQLSRLIGVDGLEEALRDWPSGTFSLPKALSAIENLAVERDTIVWLDHVESPALTPRHPLDVDALLWGLRSMSQRQERLRLVVSARGAFHTEILGPERAFFEQGRWIDLDNPPAPIWGQVGEHLGLPVGPTRELAALAGGHPATMLRGLAVAADAGPELAGREIFRDLAATSHPLAARSVQHARSLHRLGAQVLDQLARGLRPYAESQRGGSPPQEIRRVLGRLRLAGLIRHDPGGWSVVDPLVGAVLSGRLEQAVVADEP